MGCKLKHYQSGRPADACLLVFFCKAHVRINRKKERTMRASRKVWKSGPQDKERDALDVWLSEINYTSIDLHEDPKAYVKCRSKNNLINYCNLVRYDASRIGCAKKVCDGKTSILCLTNKE
ncbi:hypothetical protein Y032_0489g2361 [Ancylostoma ceylanicum]|uniref:SCP domain-containing protein n=1 Tax=Ancylostoma ceylanicum TaxID=53326 RepID=A0A016WV84_9BILA|nr:hypothetical protein Y032_0489g2361 [Ancylostoma ceylanicum]